MSEPISTVPKQFVTVLSYNICFQAMTHNATGSAPNLGAVCDYLPNSKLTSCGNNMASLIESIPASANVAGFDFVGFQEASRYYEMTNAAPSTLGKMTCIHSRQGRSDMASYYDGAKYNLTKKFFGEFSPDRPFQILVFKNTFDQSGTIFINVHNPHGYSYKQMKEHFGIAVSNDLDEQEHNYRIIMVGDYNETSWDWKNRNMFCRSWTPLAAAGIEKPVTINAPIISCAEDGKWANADMKSPYKRGGDYIFDSHSAAVIKVPPKYPYDEYLSDHLPVLALLPS